MIAFILWLLGAYVGFNVSYRILGESRLVSIVIAAFWPVVVALTPVIGRIKT